MGRLRTPGPGSYDLPPSLQIGGSPFGQRPTASFASSSKRSGSAKNDASGDPGAYDIERSGVHLGRKEPMSARSGRSFNRDVNSGRGSFNSTVSRSTSAPPRATRGGPGEHDYSHLYTCGNSSTQVTSSFLSAMPLGGHIRKSDTPGVGAYDANKVSPKNFGKEGSSMFAGAQKSRSVSGNSTTGQHVGPGSYELEQSSIQHQMAASVNPRSPGFGSSSIRTGAGSRSGSPSPGAYNAALGETISARTQRSFNTSASGGRASFGTFTKREGAGRKSDGGDPGSYTVEQPGVHTGKAESISARSRRSFNRDVNSGRGSFNSTSQRSNTPPPRSTRGGPGEHDYSHLYTCGNSSTQVTSSFLSAMPLGGHIRKSDTPGVGAYDANKVNPKNFGKEGSSMFAGAQKSRSVSGNSTTGQHVGPGSYELEQSSIHSRMLHSTNPRLPGFASSSVRATPDEM